MSDLSTETLEPIISNEELQQMLLAKQLELNQQIEENLKLQKEVTTITNRTLKVHEKNQLLSASPELAAKMAEMDYHLNMAQKFISSKAFPTMTAEQAYTIIQAGQEMGMKPVEAMNSLYIVNGSINPYGTRMIARLTAEGYNVEYSEESKDGVTVRVYQNENGFEAKERVTAQEMLAMNSKAYRFAPKSKMRYHGVRMILNFYLPHLFDSISDIYGGYFKAWDEQQQNQPATFEQTQRIDQLLKTSDIPHESAAEIDNILQSLEITNKGALDIIEYLKKNQLEQSVKNGNTNSIKKIGEDVKMAVDMPNT